MGTNEGRCIKRNNTTVANFKIDITQETKTKNKQQIQMLSSKLLDRCVIKNNLHNSVRKRFFCLSFLYILLVVTVASFLDHSSLMKISLFYFFLQFKSLYVGAS